LHLAYHDDEAAVLGEFAARAAGHGYELTILSPEEVRRRSPMVCPAGLVAGLLSATEVCVDPRAVIAGLPKFLAEQYGVEFHFGHAVTGYEAREVRTGGPRVAADMLWVCSGDDLETLYPEVLGRAELIPCKLQMMRTPSVDWRLGPMLAAGLTLLHYKAFADCPTLPVVRERLAVRHSRHGVPKRSRRAGVGRFARVWSRDRTIRQPGH
jgi:glycine/D-amino acid oxidase-like deaminating enzyme